jgi:DNA-3-methyladenine glycosylase I
MEKRKCGWCLGSELYEQYHYTAWGVPVYDDETLFEFLILETMQAGLSWITILKKRANYYAALDQYDIIKIAGYTDAKKQDLLLNAGIIRNKLKVHAIVTNAQLFLDIQKEHGSFSSYIWAFVDRKPIKNKVVDYKKAPATTAVSERISKDLKKRGFKFVGPTVMYAFMQATGMVNDHEVACFRYDAV